MDFAPAVIILAGVVALILLDAARHRPRGDADEPTAMAGAAARGMVARYGITRQGRVVTTNAIVTALAVVLVLCFAWYVSLAVGATVSTAAETAAMKDILQAAALVVGFSLTFYQWRLARFEASVEKYYDRLDVSNRRLNTLIEQAWSNKEAPKDFGVHRNPPEVGVSLFDMWVFSELDNLEYVIQKYRRGYIEPDQMCRALHAFQSRCNDPEFMQRAVGFCRGPNYHPSLRSVVRRVHDERAAARRA